MREIFDNIKKIYTFSEPCGELQDFIEFFSESSAEETQRHIGCECFTVKMFPSWTPTIYINLGTPYGLALGHAQKNISSADDILILRNNIVERVNLPADHIFTIKFYPGGLEAITGINQKYFIDKVAAATVVLPAELLHELKLAQNFEDRVQLLQQFFLSKLYRAKVKSHYIQFVQDAVGAFNTGGMQYNNSQLAEKMFTTSKTIYRYFNNVVGTSPKNYLCILRTRAALTAYVTGKNNFDPDLHGYYDMSHFYKDVIKFTGQKLAERLR